MAQEQIELELDGKVIPVPADIVSEIAAAAAARAGISQRHRELSLHLNRALDSGRVALRQADIRALVAVLEEEHPERFGPAAADLRSAVA